METGGNSDWPNWLTVVVEVAKWVLGALTTVVVACGGWALTMYRYDKAMLVRHDELLKAADKEMGEQKAWRQRMDGAPIGVELIAEFEDLKKADRLLHRRITARRRKQEDLELAIAKLRAEVTTDLKWIKDFLLEWKKDK